MKESSHASCSCLLRPALLTEGHLLARRLPAAVDLTLPRPIFTKSLLGVVGVIKVNLRDLSLDESPHAPMNERALARVDFVGSRRWEERLTTGMTTYQ